MDKSELLRKIEQCITSGSTILNLSANYLTTLPTEIGNIINLQSLNLSGNQITELPPEIGNLENLQSLNLWSNRLTIQPTEMWNLANLQSLNLSGNRLKNLPMKIGKLAKLQKLELTYNRLTALPTEMWNLANLQSLNLKGNQLTELPTEIGNLVNLSSLNLQGNRLTALPQEIGNLVNLQKLNLAGNQLTTLPTEIGNLTNLQELDLRGTHLTELPLEIGKLANLKWIYLSRTLLTTLPPEIGMLTKLQELDLSNNHLTELPREIGMLTNLHTLNLKGNPLTIPPPEIVSQGTDAILSYIRNLQEAHVERYEAKLLILGDGGVGKTCLSRALRGLPFAPQRSTQGVDIAPWEFPHPKDPGETVTLNIWDFEGQEINHQTHQFFLTKRSLYILVFNGRRQFNFERMEYWLETIRTRAPHSTVIIVATECGKATPAVPLDRLKAEYGDLLKNGNFYFATECEYMYGIPELVDRLKKCAVDKTIISFMGEPWPQSHANAEKAIKKISESRDHITRPELHRIYENSAIPEEDFTMVSSLMGDMGKITHFPDCADLRDFIVLKPHWLTKAISLVMEDKELAENQGERTLQWLDDKWKNDYPELTSTFHNAMKEFELCYDLNPDDSDNPESVILVPLRFGYVKPEIPWSDITGAAERRICYRFDMTPPAGIMSRFIVKTHHMIVKTEAMKKGIYWFNGVFLGTGGGEMRIEALCEFDREARIFTITVKAAYPQNMLERLNGIAQAVFSFFEGLKPGLHYGCIKDDATTCTGFHSVDKIMFTLSRGLGKGLDSGSREILCEYGLHDVDALSLINGFTSFADSAFAKDDLKRMLREELDKSPYLAKDIGKDIARDVDSVVRRVDALSKEVFGKEVIGKEVIMETPGVGWGISEIPAGLRQRFRHALWDYLNLFGDMTDLRDFTPVPSIISIAPADGGDMLPHYLLKTKFRLTPYCEYEEGVHKTDYHLDFRMPKMWWEETLRVAGLLFDTLRVGLTAAFAAILPADGHAADSHESRAVTKYDVSSMGKLLDFALDAPEFALKNAGRKSRAIGIKGHVISYDAEFPGIDAEFRQARIQLAELLKEIAPSEYAAKKWGELERLRMKDNTYRWFCKRHADEYRKMF